MGNDLLPLLRKQSAQRPSRVQRDQSVEEEESPLENSGYVAPDLERHHPFTDDILNTELPAKWKGLSIDKYDGMTNPDEHIEAYETDMRLYTNNQ